jgi:hypothetical protein
MYKTRTFPYLKAVSSLYLLGNNNNNNNNNNSLLYTLNMAATLTELKAQCMIIFLWSGSVKTTKIYARL